MFVTFSRESFAKRFSLAAKTASSADLNPVLRQVLLTANQTENTACLTATDTERTIKIELPSPDVTDGGTVLLPTGLFTKILGANPNAEAIDLKLDNDILTVTIGSATYKVPVMQSGDFPALADGEDNNALRLASVQLIDALNLTSWAVDNDNNKYALSGVLFEPGADDRKLHLVATDGRRLSVVHDQAEFTEDTVIPESAQIVPAKTLQLVRQIAQLSGADVAVSASNSVIRFAFPDIVLQSRLIDGRFPAWRKIMPDINTRHKWIFGTDILLAAVRAASVVTTQLSPGIFIEFNADGAKVTAEAEGTGASSMSVNAEEAPDKICTVKLDPAFVVQYLSALDKDGQVAVYVSDEPGKSVLFGQPVYAGESVYVLMPLA